MARKFKSSPTHDAVEKAMPGWSVVRVDSYMSKTAARDAAAPKADAVMPSTETLKRKFLQTDARSAKRDSGVSDDNDSSTVIVESKGMKKAVGISRTGKVLWRQG